MARRRSREVLVPGREDAACGPGPTGPRATRAPPGTATVRVDLTPHLENTYLRGLVVADSTSLAGAELYAGGNRLFRFSADEIRAGADCLRPYLIDGYLDVYAAHHLVELDLHVDRAATREVSSTEEVACPDESTIVEYWPRGEPGPRRDRGVRYESRATRGRVARVPDVVLRVGDDWRDPGGGRGTRATRFWDVVRVDPGRHGAWVLEPSRLVRVAGNGDDENDAVESRRALERALARGEPFDVLFANLLLKHGGTVGRLYSGPRTDGP